MKALRNINFPDYSKFNNVDDAYFDFIDKLITVIDKIAPTKEICTKIILKSGLMRK